MREIIAAIDIGGEAIKLVVAEMLGERLNILCALTEQSRGVKKGAICEPDETGYALKKLLKKAEEMLGTKISKALVTVNEDSADFKVGEGSITITSDDKEIGVGDITRVLKQSVGDNIHKGNDLVTVVPISFKVDGVKVHNPKEMKGSKLSVKSVIVSVPKREIYTTAKCLEKVGVEVVDVVIPSIGTYWAHKNVSTDTETGIVIDLGYDTTKISVFNKGIIVNNLVIGVGGKNVDNDISFIYKVTQEQASDLKRKLALANKKNARESEKQTLVNTLGQKITINQKELTEVVMSRLREILNMAKNEINYLTKKEISYIIISGGLSETRDFPLEVESVFGTKANAGKIMVVGARSNEYATAIGMIKFFDYKLKLRDRDFSTFTQDEIDIICGGGEKRINLGDSVLGKVFGIFFDN